MKLKPGAEELTILLLTFTFHLCVTPSKCAATTNATLDLLEALIEFDNDHNSNSSSSTAISSKAEPEPLQKENSSINKTDDETTQIKQNSTVLNSNTTKRTCACDDSEESLICANNGVTYKNTCRFECAQAKVTRLRQVKQGRCSPAAGAQSYWQSKKSG